MHGELVFMRARRLTFSAESSCTAGRGDVWVINGVKPRRLVAALASASRPTLLSLSCQVTPAGKEVDGGRWGFDLEEQGGLGWICPSVLVPGGNLSPAEMLADFNLNALMMMKLEKRNE